jgi:hypothetical protein
VELGQKTYHPALAFIETLANRFTLWWNIGGMLFFEAFSDTVALLDTFRL